MGASVELAKEHLDWTIVRPLGSQKMTIAVATPERESLHQLGPCAPPLFLSSRPGMRAGKSSCKERGKGLSDLQEVGQVIFVSGIGNMFQKRRKIRRTLLTLYQTGTSPLPSQSRSSQWCSAWSCAVYGANLKFKTLIDRFWSRSLYHKFKGHKII